MLNLVLFNIMISQCFMIASSQCGGIYKNQSNLDEGFIIMRYFIFIVVYFKWPLNIHRNWNPSQCNFSLKISVNVHFIIIHIYTLKESTVQVSYKPSFHSIPWRRQCVRFLHRRSLSPHEMAWSLREVCRLNHSLLCLIFKTCHDFINIKSPFFTGGGIFPDFYRLCI